MIDHIGIKLPNWGRLATFDALSATAQAAEAAGFASVWVSDHVALPLRLASDYPFSVDGRPPFQPETPFQDPLISLAWAGAVTQRVQLATGVLVGPVRNDFLLAKQVSTLDAISGGRVVLGLGAGWLEEEFALVGQSYHRRTKQLAEGIEQLRTCWRDDIIDVSDRFPAVGPIVMEPKPLRRAEVPILIGGHGPITLRHAATIADGWYGSSIDAAAFGSLDETVRGLRREALGDVPFRTGVKLPVFAADVAARTVDAYEAAGADFVVVDVAFGLLTAEQSVDEIGRLGDALDVAGRTQQPLSTPAVAAR